MAILNIPDAGNTIDDPSRIAEYLGSIGIKYDRWPVVEINAAEADSEVIKAYSYQIEKLKADAGYVESDVVTVRPEIPGLEGMLDKFRREHWHDEDEVRFVVDGRGLFHIVPDRGDVVSVEMEAGDLICVPGGRLHWFDVCGEKRFRAIRLFSDRAGWTPKYTDSGRNEKYHPMCFDESPFRNLL